MIALSASVACMEAPPVSSSFLQSVEKVLFDCREEEQLARSRLTQQEAKVNTASLKSRS